MVDHSAAPLRAGTLFPVGWSPDGKSVYAFPFTGSALLSISTGGGDPKTIVTFPGEIVNAVVTPDGKKFVCDVEDAKSDVWVVDNFDPSRRK